MELTLTAAAQATGKGKSTLLRAVKSGKLSSRRTDEGAFLVDASELARVFPMNHLDRTTDAPLMHRDAPRLASGEPADAELITLRERVVGLEARLSREQDAVEDLRRRLDQEQEERRKLQHLLLMPPEKPKEPQEPPVVVDELRKRLEEAEARIAALSAPPAAEKPQEPPSMAPVVVERVEIVRAFLSRLLRR